MSNADAAHVPVLLDVVLEALAITPAGCYVDATFGRGGHSDAILQRLGPAGGLLVMDRDPDAAACAERRYEADQRVRVVRGSFTLLEQAVEKAGMTGHINGVLIDLGVSSPQLDDPARGFSFMHDGALDMRMDPAVGEPVAAWLNRAGQADITRVLREYGEEPHARRIARAIVEARPLHHTRELAELIASVVPRHEPGRHPATRTFQALRIFINRELDELSTVLPQTLRVLAPGGRLVVISFHSLEDRIVKRFMREESRGDPYPADLPIQAAALHPQLRLIGSARRPDAAETERNPRARSAIMRVAERISA
jgi:16S rRNA (cytosine1402-N4)-methyltransferase